MRINALNDNKKEKNLQIMTNNTTNDLIPISRLCVCIHLQVLCIVC